MENIIVWFLKIGESIRQNLFPSLSKLMFLRLAISFVQILSVYEVLYHMGLHSKVQGRDILIPPGILISNK